MSGQQTMNAVEAVRPVGSKQSTSPPDAIGARQATRPGSRGSGEAANAAPGPVRVNGVGIETFGATQAEIRERALNELLRQVACERGLLEAGQSAQSAPEAFATAIDRLLEADVPVREPDETECRRYFEGNPARFAHGERVKLSHILFAVTPGVPVVALRKTAEQALLDLRTAPETFAEQAARLSNCPSRERGGALGWLQAGEAVPEFESEVLRHAEVGVLPRLVHSRHGLHVVKVEQREPGKVPEFDAVSGAVRAALSRENHVTALRHYLQQLAAQAEFEGVDFEQPASPLLR